MIFVDTSVWIEFFRGKNTAIVNKLSNLLDEDAVALCDIVYLELLNGAKKSEVEKLRRVLKALPRYSIGTQNIDEIEGWLLGSRQRGYKFGIADLLIASTVNQAKSKLWSLDSDFKYMKKLGWIDLDAAPATA